MPGLYAEILAVICSICRPSICALSLGAVVSGLTPIILRRVQRGRPPLGPVAVPWTGCPQSFIDLVGEGPYVDANQQITRTDVWRLLHLPTTVEDELSYNYRPCTPWEPCGKLDTKNCALCVASHLNCTRYQLRYNRWNWELEDNQIIQNEGLSIVTAPVMLDVGPFAVQKLREIPHRPFDQEKSQESSWEASLDIFRWFVINGEGFPPEPIYKDDWLESLGHEDSDEESEEEEYGDENISDALLQERIRDLKLWLGTIE